MFAAAAYAVVGLWGVAAGQSVSVAVHVSGPPGRPLAANVIMPQSRTLVHSAGGQRVLITEVKAGVVILEQAATTTMDISLRNPGGSRMEAELVLPVPDGAVIRGFTFEGAATEPSAEVLLKDDARKFYSEIVAKTRDPAILEFAGCNLVRSSVFPIDPNGTQKVRLTYEHLLTADGRRVDYLLPRSESVDYKVPWKISVMIKSKAPIATVYSPSHMLNTERLGGGAVQVKLAETSAAEPGPFRLSYLLAGEDVTASLLAYPDARVDGGYFLLLAGLPAKSDSAASAIKREITLVIDRSGSMTGEKLEQARAAAIQILQGLQEGETFNILDYSDSVASFAPAPVAATKKNLEDARHYVRQLSATSGTNLLEALLESVRPKPGEGMLPIVLFLTDGLPTVGTRDEATIRESVAKANKFNRRIFTFGVGYDVNAPLLTHLANNSRAVSTFVLPNENVEAKVSQVYRRLAGPVLADPVLEAVGKEGELTRIADLLPRQLPDMFEGDNLVLLGRYRGDQPVTLRLRGNYLGKPRTFQFHFELNKATNKNSFVPRLWASRKIGYLVDDIRQAGATPATAKNDPRTKELVDEILRLSVEYGILTEYTAFLAREGTDLTKRDAIMAEANGNFVARAQNTRTGQGGVNQSYNGNFMQSQGVLNTSNTFYNANMERVQTTRVQQINDRAFFNQNGRWIDSQAITNGTPAKADATIRVGSDEYNLLLEQLTRENRNGALSLGGEVLLNTGGRNILITNH